MPIRAVLLATCALLIAAPAWPQQDGAAAKAAMEAARDAAEAAKEAAGVAVSASAAVPNGRRRQLSKPPTDAVLAKNFASAKLDVANTGSLADQWQAELWRELQSGSLDSAAQTMAARHGMSAKPMHELAGAWLAAGFFGEHRWEYDDEDGARASPAGRSLEARLLALPRQAGQSDLVYAVAAKSLERMDFCNPVSIDGLPNQSSDPASKAWLIAQTTGCSVHYLGALSLDPQLTLPVAIALSQDTELAHADRLALFEYLTSEAGLAGVASAERERLSAHLLTDYLGELVELGFAAQALERYDRLPQGLRQAVTGPPLAGTLEVSAANRKVRLSWDKDKSGIGPNLAVAMWLAGRKAEACELFGRTGVPAETRKSFECLSGAAIGKGCERTGQEASLSPLLVDQLLSEAGSDPYPLAEAMFARSHGPGLNAIEAEAACAVLSEPGYAEICRKQRHNAIYASDPGRSEYERGDLALDAFKPIAALPGVAEARQHYSDAQIARARQYAPDLIGASTRRASTKPEAAPFAEQALPETVRAQPSRQDKWPKDAAPLPDGFGPVRFERKGSEAVAVSLSTMLDPTGEISQGGYWVHRSHDGGKTWRAPLYAGLPQFFPYVVLGQARMPLLSGDGIDLEVTIQEIDTASITYPPVGLASSRTAKDLFLHLPFADLERDSDGDGLSDIAARHLLLNQPGPAAAVMIGAPGAPRCGGDPEGVQAALSQLVGKLFRIEAHALIEPVDAPEALEARFGLWKGTANSGRGPIFLTGDPASYACLRSDRPIIVYRPEALKAMASHSPDFRPVALPPIVFNRARDRGFVSFSFGWTGGTLRLRRKNGQWTFEEIESWIT